MSNSHVNKRQAPRAGTITAEREISRRGKVLTYRTLWTGHVEYMFRNNTPVFEAEHNAMLGVFARVGLRGGPAWIFFPGRPAELLRVLNTGKKIFGVASLLDEQVRLPNSETIERKLMVSFALDMERRQPKHKLIILSDREHVREDKTPVHRLDVPGTFGAIEVRSLTPT
ncbi:MAG: hypothetical protein KBC16_01370 [Candidatus Pacebacteria bacterium]|nr:hypothetical protein [Candidatus Paceibacterota bacterium]